MRIGSHLRQLVHENWGNKESILAACANEFGSQMWDNDPMYGHIRDREDHALKTAKLGFALGVAKSPDEFLAEIEKLETPTEEWAKALKA